MGSSPSPFNNQPTQECFHYVPTNETVAATLTRWRKPQKDLSFRQDLQNDGVSKVEIRGQKKRRRFKTLYIYIFMSHISICGGSSVEVKKIKHDISPSQGDILKKVLD